MPREDLNTLTIDLRGRQIPAAEGVDAKGVPMTLTNIRGQKIRGVFIRQDPKGPQESVRRNGCVSAVAELLGVPELAVRVRGLRFVNGAQGNQDGVFTASPEGADLFGSPESCSRVADQPFGPERQGSGKLLRQLADLQVLDYLCGHPSRQQSSLAYRLDERGQVVGIQGVENGEAFTGSAGKDNLLSPEKMLVVSKSMADRLKSLKPEQMKQTLKGWGLSEQAMSDAGERLHSLQEQIKAASRGAKTAGSRREGLVIVPDDHFGELSLDSLSRQGSYFQQVRDSVQGAVRSARAQGFFYEPRGEAVQRPLRVPQHGPQHTAQAAPSPRSL
ncbi:MAG: hypothetical protein IKS05_04625 [Oscillospiraceae bacterium]|nr:hypothetical protein [Oscillospiraceae bacterium]